MKKFLFSVLTGASLFADNYINLQITDNTIMIEGEAKISYNQPFYVRGGYMINTDEPNFIYGGIKSEGQIIGVDLPVKFSLFLDYVYKKNNSALPIGIGASGYLQQFAIPVFIRGEFEYAPKVLSFNEADKFVKYKIETGVQFIENGEVFAGYRNIRFNENYDSNLYVGVGFSF
jgi:hypothetical protein